MKNKFTIPAILKSYWSKDIGIYLLVALFSGAGTYLTAINLYDLLFARSDKMTVMQLFVPSVILGALFFLWQGLYMFGFLRRRFSIQEGTTKINVKFGDIFSQQGVIVIGVNNYFDSEINTDFVSTKTLHGILLEKYWKNNLDDWCSQIYSSIEKDKLIRQEARPYYKHKAQYAIGTTALVVRENLKVICVAQAETNEQLIAEGSDVYLLTAVHAALRRARECCNGESLNLPLLGSGLARLNLTHNEIVNLILTGIIAETKKQKITSEINLILHLPDMDKFDFISLQKFWKK